MKIFLTILKTLILTTRAKGAPITRGQSDYEFESASEYDVQDPPEPVPVNDENYPTLGEAGPNVAPPPLAPKKKKIRQPRTSVNVIVN